MSRSGSGPATHDNEQTKADITFVENDFTCFIRAFVQQLLNFAKLVGSEVLEQPKGSQFAKPGIIGSIREKVQWPLHGIIVLASLGISTA